MSGLYGRVRQLMAGLNVRADGDLYQVLFDTAAAGMVSINADGEIQACNPALCRMFGYRHDELLGQNIRILMPARHGEQHQHYIRHYLQTGEASVMGRGRGLVARRSNGEEFPVHLTVSEMDLAGERSFTAIVHDLTSAAGQPALLQADRTWLGSILDQTPAAVMVKDTEGRYLLLNRRAEELLHMRSSALAGKRDDEVFAPVWATLQQRTDAEARAADNALTFIEPFPATAGSGGGRVFLTSKNRLLDARGAVSGTVSVALDISGMPLFSGDKDEGAALLLNHFDQPLALIAEQGDVLQANDAYAGRFGLSAAAIRGCRIDLLEPAEVLQCIQDCLNSEEPDAEAQLTDAQTLLRIQKHVHQGQTFLLLSGVSSEKPAESPRVAGSAGFIASLSHELRTPLNAVIGFSQLLRQPLTASVHDEAVEMVERAGRHLLGLVDQVLELVKHEAQVAPLEPRPTEAGALLRECLELVQQQAAERNIRLEYQLEADDPWILADRLRCKQIVLNLLTNAIKFNEPGGLVLLRLTGTQGQRLRISVQDTGPGIAAADCERIFSPFERLQPDAGEGSGLGLAISRALAERMDGRLGVDSAPGRGSCFWLELPAASPLYAFPAAAPQPRAVAACRVLYIEDNPANARYVELGLSGQQQVQLQIARSGREGLALAREQQPDVILLDMRLPDIHGLEVLEQLRSLPELGDARIYGVSAEALPEQIQAACLAGASGYMTKPFDLNRLLELLDVPAQPAH